MKREELKGFYYGYDPKMEAEPNAYWKQDADLVMDALEARIKELEAVISKLETSQPKWILGTPSENEEGEVFWVTNGKHVQMCEWCGSYWRNEPFIWSETCEDVIAYAECKRPLPPPPTEKSSSTKRRAR